MTPSSLADVIDDDVATTPVTPNTWTDDLNGAYEKASANGNPVFVFWEAPTAYSKADRDYLTRTSFKKLFSKYGDTYFLHANVHKKSVRDFKRFLFTQIGTFDGFAQSLTETGSDHISNLPTHSEYSMIYVDDDRVRFLFHIRERFQYRGDYDSNLDYAYSPYHDDIKLDDTLFRSGSYSSYDFPFLRVIDDYLSMKVPSPQASATPGVDVRSSVVARFTITVRDRLYKGEVENVVDTNKFDIVERAGLWFVDQDDVLRGRVMNKSGENAKSVLVLSPKTSGTLCLKSDPYNPAFIDTANNTTNETDAAYLLHVSCQTNTVVRFDPDTKIVLYGESPVVTTFDAR